MLVSKHLNQNQAGVTHHQAESWSSLQFGDGREQPTRTWISMWQMSTWPASAAACRGDRLPWCSILKLGSIPSTVNKQVWLPTWSWHEFPATRPPPGGQQHLGLVETGLKGTVRSSLHRQRGGCWKPLSIQILSLLPLSNLGPSNCHR